MPKFFKTVLLTGLFVGTTDLISAYVSSFASSGKFSAKMLYFIAGGALGLETALKGGNAIALLGIFFHYFIAFAYTLFFFLIFPRLKFLSYNKYLVGMLYGVFVNLTMNQIVLRFSRMPVSPLVIGNVIIEWLTLGIIFGIPIAYNAYKYYGNEF